MPHHPPQKEISRVLIVALILLVGFVFRFQYMDNEVDFLTAGEETTLAQSHTALTNNDYEIYYEESDQESLYVYISTAAIGIFGDGVETLRFVSGFFGFATVLGLYLLTKRLFNWQIAAFSSFFLAISMWHAIFSRVAERYILIPFFMVWGLYFLWRGKQSGHVWFFAASGLFFGLGLHVHIGFWIMLVVVALVLLTYRQSAHTHLTAKRFDLTYQEIFQGLITFTIVILILIMPFWILHTNGSFDVLSRLTLFENANVDSLALSGGQFFNVGQHNFALLLWPIELLFVIGLLRDLIQLFKKHKEHGHFSTVHVLVLLWFLVGIVPSLITGQPFNAAQALLVAPVMMIFAGEALWWIYDFVAKWYRSRDAHEVELHQHHWSEGQVVAAITISIFLFAMTAWSYKTMFYDWRVLPIDLETELVSD